MAGREKGGQSPFAVCRAGKRAVVLVVLVGLVAQGRAQSAGDPTPAVPWGTVTVFAAASLTAAFQAIGRAFEQAHPGARVQCNFGGSSTLVQQIQQGAPADVFAAADEANMQTLVDSGEVTDPPQPFARNSLQIAVAPGNPKHIHGLSDFARPGLTIALCGPSVPCGRYAAEAFARAGVTVPAASQEIDVKAVLNKVALGEADVGIVYVTDVRAAGGKVEGVDIPASANVMARYPIAILNGAPNTPAARAFRDFVLSADGQRALARFGFFPR